MRIGSALLACAALLLGVHASGGQGGTDHVKLATDAAEVRAALRYVVSELKRTSNQFRYAALTNVHSAVLMPANFDGRNLALDLEFDMLHGQQARHEVLVFMDEGGVITGVALNEFPDVTLRARPDPDV